MNPMKDAEVEAAVESPTPVVTGKVSPEEQLPPHVTYPHSCRECFNDCLKKLMSLCDFQEPTTFTHALHRSFRGTRLRKMTETTDSETFVVATSKQTPTIDLVVQLYYIDTHSASRVFANLFTCR